MALYDTPAPPCSRCGGHPCRCPGALKTFGGPLDGSSAEIGPASCILVLERYRDACLSADEDPRLRPGDYVNMRIATYAFVPLVDDGVKKTVNRDGGEPIGYYRLQNGRLRWYDRRGIGR